MIVVVVVDSDGDVVVDSDGGCGGVVVDSDSGCGGCETKILSVGDWPPTRGAVSPLSLHIEHRWNK